MLRLRIKELAARKGVLLKDVASAIGLSSVTLSKLIAGKCGTTTDRLEKLCGYFECEPSELIEYLPDDELEESEKSLNLDGTKIIKAMTAEVNKLHSFLDKLERVPLKKRLSIAKSFNQILETMV